MELPKPRWAYQYAFSPLELGLGPDDLLELVYDKDMRNYVFRISVRGTHAELIDATDRLSWIFDHVAKKVKHGDRPVL